MLNLSSQSQRTFFKKGLFEELDPTNRYVVLKNNINLGSLENKASKLYSNIGRESLPFVRLVSLNIVKFIDNLSDAQTIRAYQENPYIQFFCGETEFQTQPPCAESTLSVFRKRLGDSWEEILKISTDLFDELAKEPVAIVDTTAQPKNITFPTDVKLLNKVVVRCQKLARKYGIKLNNTFKKQVKALLKTLRFEKGREKQAEVRKAKKRLMTIAGILVRELARKMSQAQYAENEQDFINYKKVIDQSNGKNGELNQLEEKIESLLALFEDLVDLLANYKDKKVETCIKKVEEIKNTLETSRRKHKIIKNSITGLKNICQKLIKILKNKLTSKEFDKISCYIAKITNFLQSINKDNKIYSLHEPNVACIAKGKAGKKYEFGSKASIAITQTSGIIVGAVNFQGNPHDSNTLKDTIECVKRVTGNTPSEIYADRGYRGSQEKNPNIKVNVPTTPSNSTTTEEKKEISKNFGRRSSIEPVIGHIKNDFRLAKTYLKGAIGDKISLIMSCAAFNFQKWINKQLGKIRVASLQ